MFKRLFKRREEDISAAKLYTHCLKQARKPALFGSGRVDDSYEGRIDLLTLHLTLVITAERKFEVKGITLNQALYDVMIQDFNIAMRGEGLADTGIARRIKPMVSLYLERTKTYTRALLSGDGIKSVIETDLLAGEGDEHFADRIALYVQKNYAAIDACSFEQLSSGSIRFTEFV